MENSTVKAVLSETAFSVKKLAAEMNVEQTSENLIAIRAACFSLVEAGEAVLYEVGGLQFFSKV